MVADKTAASAHHTRTDDVAGYLIYFVQLESVLTLHSPQPLLRFIIMDNNNNLTKKTLGLLVALDYRNPRIEFFNHNGDFFVEAVPRTYNTERMYGTYPAEIEYIQLDDNSVCIINWQLTCKEIEDYPGFFDNEQFTPLPTKGVQKWQ